MPDPVLGTRKAEMKQSNTPSSSPDSYHLPSYYYVSGLLATNAWHTENTGIKGVGWEQGEVPIGSNRQRQRQKLGGQHVQTVLTGAWKRVSSSSIHLKPTVQGRGQRDLGGSQDILRSLDLSWRNGAPLKDFKWGGGMLYFIRFAFQNERSNPPGGIGGRHSEREGVTSAAKSSPHSVQRGL